MTRLFSHWTGNWSTANIKQCYCTNGRILMAQFTASGSLIAKFPRSAICPSDLWRRSRRQIFTSTSSSSPRLPEGSPHSEAWRTGLLVRTDDMHPCCFFLLSCSPRLGLPEEELKRKTSAPYIRRHHTVSVCVICRRSRCPRGSRRGVKASRLAVENKLGGNPRARLTHRTGTATNKMRCSLAQRSVAT